MFTHAESPKCSNWEGTHSAVYSKCPVFMQAPNTTQIDTSRPTGMSYCNAVRQVMASLGPSPGVATTMPPGSQAQTVGSAQPALDLPRAAPRSMPVSIQIIASPICADDHIQTEPVNAIISTLIYSRPTLVECF